MGTIARQTIKASIYAYIGAVIGFINVAILMPHIFSTEQIGLTNILISVSAIFGQFGALGFNNVTTRLFPYFRDNKNAHNGFFTIITIAGITGFMLCLLIFFIIKPYLIKENIESSPLFVEYIYLLIPLIFISIFFILIDTYNRILFNASFGIFAREFLVRILNFAGIILFYFGIFSFNDFILYYTAVYAVPVFLILSLLYYRKEVKFKIDFRGLYSTMKKQIYSVAFFGVISGFSGIAAMHIDRYMVNHFSDLGATGIYATAFFFGTMILLPGRALYRIASSSVTEAFKAGDNKMVETIYYKSSINQLIVAVLLFILIWGNIDIVLQIMPEQYSEGKYVIFYISLAYLTIMGFGISSEIIYISKHYKTYAYIMAVLIIMIVLFNILLIPKFGITGAAIASFLSYLCYAIIKYVYIYYRFGFQPFSIVHIKVLLLGIIVYLPVSFIPDTQILILDFIINTALFVLLFTLPVYYFKFSEDINNAFNSGISFISKVLK